MNREEKNAVILELKEKIEEYGSFYITDTSGLTVAKVNDIRRKCFNRNISFKVAKNTLIRKAMEATGADYTPLFDVLNGTSGVMFCKTGNVPAKLIKELRSERGAEKPVLKGAFVVNHDFFIGDNQLDKLVAIKSKEEVLGDIISALQSGGHTIAGILKTLSEKGEE
jgi:large subunit ribosomal protein L10